MSSTIQVRIDDELKNKSDRLFKELGTDTTSAIRMFLTQAVAVNGFPFSIKKRDDSLFTPLSEREMLARLEQSRNHAKQGLLRDADDVISDMRKRYDL